jgi:rhodanese-related sulfurtransferase
MLPSPPPFLGRALLACLLAGAGATPAVAGAIPTSEGGAGVECGSTLAPDARDLSCYVTARELARWRGDDELVIVDSRPAAEFRQVRIPGSINLPLRSLRARTYLKSRRLLLVDRGSLGAELEAGCRELRSAGFTSVGIIEGGLNAWAQTMGDLEGDRAARSALNLIPARVFARAARPRDWLVLDVSAGSPDLAQLFPGAVHVPLRGDPAAFRRELGAAIRTREAGPGALFVAVVEVDGSRASDVARALSSLGVVHAFFVEGGLDAYRSALAAEQQDSLAQAQLLGGPLCGAR